MIKIDSTIGKINSGIHHRYPLESRTVNELLKKVHKPCDQGIKLTFIPIKNRTK